MGQKKPPPQRGGEGSDLFLKEGRNECKTTPAASVAGGTTTKEYLSTQAQGSRLSTAGCREYSAAAWPTTRIPPQGDQHKPDAPSLIARISGMPL